MTRFIAILNDSRHVNVLADKMVLNESMIYAYKGDALVALVDISAVIVAYLSERGDGA